MVSIAESKQVIEVLADSWYIIWMFYCVWKHSKWCRQQPTKFVELLPELLQPVYCIMDWMTYNDAVSTADVFWDMMFCHWFSGSWHIKKPHCLQNIGNDLACHKASHPKRPEPSDTPLCEPQIPQVFSSSFIWYNRIQDIGVGIPHLRWDYGNIVRNDNLNIFPLPPFLIHYVQKYI